MSEFAMFDKELKGSAYITDVPGSVKNVSSLFPLSAALVLDDPSIYAAQAYPIVESMLSRGKFLFTTDPNVRGQAATSRLNGPCAPITELAALHQLAGRATPAFLDQAVRLKDRVRVLNLDTRARGDAWPNLLALHRATGEAEYLADAITAADRYIEERIDKPATDFDDRFVGRYPMFWNQFAPAFAPLYELYAQTGESRFLEAAHRAARQYAMFVWACPAVPAKAVTVNPGGFAPSYWYLAGKGYKPIPATERQVDAWKLSEVGLTTEAANTSSRGNRAMMLMNLSPWLLRIAADTGDTFLRDLARSAIVGRYASYPGYHLNTARTDAFITPEYPFRPHDELSCTPFHYNHVWPHVAMLIDHLVTEAYYSSRGQIDFPSHYGEGYAFIQSRVYGDRPGVFFGVRDARLWMPPNLVLADNDQINYVTARSDGRLCVALMNTSAADVTTTVTLDAVRLRIDARATLSAAVIAGDATCAAEPGCRITTTVPAKGLTALAIDGVRPDVRLQHRLGRGETLPHESFAHDEETGVHAMLLEMGEGLSTAYVFLDTPVTGTELTRLHYRTERSWRTVEDAEFPFEFTVPLDDSVEAFEFRTERIDAGGASIESDVAQLTRRALPH